MAAGTSPIFVSTLRSSGITTGTAANTNQDGTGTVATFFTAGATNGSKVERVFFQHLGTNVATVIRVFINNGSSSTVAANNFLVYEVALAAWTASQIASSTSAVWYANLILPAGYKLNVTTGTAIASGVMVTGEGGDY